MLLARWHNTNYCIYIGSYKTKLKIKKSKPANLRLPNQHSTHTAHSTAQHSQSRAEQSRAEQSRAWSRAETLFTFGTLTSGKS